MTLKSLYFGYLNQKMKTNLPLQPLQKVIAENLLDHQIRKHPAQLLMRTSSNPPYYNFINDLNKLNFKRNKFKINKR